MTLGDVNELKMLSDSQRQRMQRNREKALQLRKARIANLTDAEKYETYIYITIFMYLLYLSYFVTNL